MSQISHPGLIFRISDDAKALIASFAPKAGYAADFNRSDILEAVAKTGLQNLNITESKLDDFIRRVASATEQFEIELAGLYDGEFKVDTSGDMMAAYLTIFPPSGGEPVSKDKILAELANRQIHFGLMMQNIDAALSLGKAEGVIIAEGFPAIRGEDGYLERLIPEVKDRRPKVDARGIADYRDLGEILTVHPDTPLMRRVAPKPGTDGKNVRGDVIPFCPGKDVQFAKNLPGTALDSKDNNVLISTITGQPVTIPGGIQVEPVLTLDTVDISTGNVNFDGSVIVKGDVHADMLVKATGDIHIGGTTEAATLYAKGDIVIKGGIAGRQTSQQGKAEAGYTAVIRCTGSFTARFVESAKIEAEMGIYISEAAMNADLTATTEIVVGKGSRGHIIGGISRASTLVKAKVLGSPNGTITKIEVGVNPFAREKVAQIDIELEKIMRDNMDIKKILDFASKFPDKVPTQTVQRAQLTADSLALRHSELEANKQILLEQLALCDGAKVEIDQAAYAGVQLKIGNKSKGLTDTVQKRGAFELVKGMIAFG